MTNLKPWKVIKSKAVHKTSWIEIIEDRCVVEDKEITYTYTKRVDEGPTIIPEEKLGKLWLVRQYRHPIKKIVWQFPAEGKHPNESWIAAANRGLDEELSIRARKLHELGVMHPDPGGLEQTTQYFLAEGLEHTNKKIHKEQLTTEIEELESACFHLDEIETLIENGEICDGWTLMGLYLYRKYRKLGW